MSLKFNFSCLSCYPRPPGFTRSSPDQDDSRLSRQKKDAVANRKSQVNLSLIDTVVERKKKKRTSFYFLFFKFVQLLKL
ncbi:hypothetical protein LguiA_004526 [Lonicera macranthoides]